MADSSDTFVGFVTLEDTLAFLLPTRNTSDVPTAADSAPTWAIYKPASAARGSSLKTGTVGAASETGIYPFTQAINAADGFAAGGLYSIQFNYAISSSSRRKVYTFMVT